MVLTVPVGDIVGGIVRIVVTASGGDPARLVLTGPRITLLFASAIVIGAAFYASRAIDWRAKSPGSEATDA